MWVKFKGDTKEIYLRDKMDKPLELNNTGAVQVPEELGEFLIENYNVTAKSADEPAEAEREKETEEVEVD